MSLNFYYGDVKNPERWGSLKKESECTPEELNEWTRMRYFAFFLMGIDVGSVTEKTLKEVCFRGEIWQSITGSIMTQGDIDAPYTCADIKSYIGYSTNVYTTTRTEFMRKVTNHVEHVVTRVLNSLDEVLV